MSTSTSGGGRAEILDEIRDWFEFHAPGWVIRAWSWINTHRASKVQRYVESVERAQLRAEANLCRRVADLELLVRVQQKALEAVGAKLRDHDRVLLLDLGEEKAS